MITLKSFSEDAEIIFHIMPEQTIMSVHLHTVDADGKFRIKELPFEVKNNVARAVIPAETQFMDEPHIQLKTAGGVIMVKAGIKENQNKDE